MNYGSDIHRPFLDNYRNLSVGLWPMLCRVGNTRTMAEYYLGLTANLTYLEYQSDCDKLIQDLWKIEEDRMFTKRLDLRETRKAIKDDSLFCSVLQERFNRHFKE